MTRVTPEQRENISRRKGPMGRIRPTADADIKLNQNQISLLASIGSLQCSIERYSLLLALSWLLQRAILLSLQVLQSFHCHII